MCVCGHLSMIVDGLCFCSFDAHVSHKKDEWLNSCSSGAPSWSAHDAAGSSCRTTCCHSEQVFAPCDLGTCDVVGLIFTPCISPSITHLVHAGTPPPEGAELGVTFTVRAQLWTVLIKSSQGQTGRLPEDITGQITVKVRDY